MEQTFPFVQHQLNALSSLGGSDLPDQELGSGRRIDAMQDSLILVVEDEPLIRENLAEYLRQQEYQCETAGSGKEALQKLRKQSFDLVITDIRMPGFTGVELLREISHSYPDTAVIMITAVADLQTAVQSMKQGAYDYITKPFDLEKVMESVRSTLHTAAVRKQDHQITERLKSIVQTKSSALDLALKDLELHRSMTLEALVRALDAREHETQCHSLRVQAYTLRLAQELDFEEDQLTDLGRGALLHDIGKIGVSDSILLKPGNLTPSEWEEMRKHPAIGYEIVSGIKFLENCAQLILCHHERYDGRGYPAGLRGEQIPLEARIFAVIDTYDAITSNRPYRQALSSDHARAEIQVQSGSQFDPRIVELFLRISQEDLDRIADQYS
ncbi:MAG TPA: HD domain-containing phosphohydrolase [Acidobacteriota bacterium]|nr:HD domain-containing phosphohydrolase [Acidobacteriota bacterium]